MGFVSCDGYEEPNALPQTNPQEAIFAANGVAVTPNTGVLDLVAANASGDAVELATVTLTDFPQDYVLHLMGELSTSEDFGHAVTFDATATDGVVSISADDLNGAYTASISKDPSQRTVKVRYAAYAVNGTSVVRIGNPDLYFGPYDLTLKPFAPAEVIEEAYYLALSPDGVNWPAAKAIKLDHSDKSQYDDPQFAVATVFNTDDVTNGLYWMIVPQSTYATGNLSGGLWYAPTEEGMFDQQGKLQAINGPMTIEDNKAGIVLIDGDVLFTVNMETKTFDYIAAVANFWTPGGGNGVSFGEPALWTNNYVDYFGYAYLSGEFKFSPSAGWNGGDFGSDEGIAYEEVDGIQVGHGVAQGSQNIAVPADGLYWITLNYPTRELELTQVKSYGMIGGFNGWSESTVMTPSADMLTWTGEVTLTAGDEYKFRANNGWDINLGGELTNLTQNGDNLKATETGTFTVTLDLSTNPYSATLVKK